jgi:aspartate kinase
VALLVQKFGGTSVADPERIRAVADHVARTVRRGNQVVVVISAMGKETDELLRLARDVSTTRPGREMDMLVTAGERKATALLCMAIADLGVEAESFTGSQAGFRTDSTHMNAKITEVRPDRIRDALAAGRVPVVGGAQGVSPERNVTFLGRGGSDTTAVAIAHALGADSCELYTDVSGVFTSDPRVVPDARKMEHVSFDELLEMTANGCPKPAMRSVEFARTHGVDLHVRSAFTWESGTDISFTVPHGDLTRTTEICQAQAAELGASSVTGEPAIARVSVVGAGMKSHPGVAATVFETLAKEGINIEMIATSAIRVSCVVAESDAERAVVALHDVFGLADGPVFID